MRKITFFILLLILIFTGKTYSQWNLQYTTSYMSGITSVKFSDSLNGFVTGFYANANTSHASILHTNNGGVNWNISVVPDSMDTIVDAKFISQNLVYAGGNHKVNIPGNYLKPQNILAPIDYQPVNANGITYKGAFIISTDGGVSWKNRGTVPDNVEYFQSIDFLNSNYGFATCSIGNMSPVGAMMKTTNGGISWEFMNLPTDFYSLESVKVIDSLNIIAAGTKNINSVFTGIIFKTSNAGLNWSMQTFPDVNIYMSLCFINTNTGICAGISNRVPTGGSIYKTTDKGISWFNAADGNADSSGLYNVDFLPNGTGLIVGRRYVMNVITVLKSTDFGASWKRNYINSNSLAQSTNLINSENYFLASGKANTEAYIFHTTNGGSTFINNNSNHIPNNFILSQNYPNPFNPSTKINYELKASAEISLNIFDANGRLIKILESGFKQAGNYQTNFSADGLSSGVYYYSLYADGVLMATKKMLLLK